jgi:Flp pilus assembly protein TadB
VTDPFAGLSEGELVALLLVSAAAFLVVFLHAQRHGSKHATAWGVAAFLAAGVVVPVYFVRYWLRRRR